MILQLSECLSAHNTFISLLFEICVCQIFLVTDLRYNCYTSLFCSGLKSYLFRVTCHINVGRVHVGTIFFSFFFLFLIYFLIHGKVANFTIKTVLFLYFLKMLIKKWDSLENLGITTVQLEGFLNFPPIPGGKTYLLPAIPIKAPLKTLPVILWYSSCEPPAIPLYFHWNGWNHRGL